MKSKTVTLKGVWDYLYPNDQLKIVQALGFVGYTITNDGRIFNAAGVMLEPSLNGNGYLKYTLAIVNSRTTVLAHRLVLQSFTRQTGTGEMQVAHLDGNKLNNRLENLVWASAKENSDHKVVHKTMARGERIGNSKLTEEQVKTIRETFHRGGPRDSNLIFLAEKYGVSTSTIYLVIKRKVWAHV